MGCHFLLQGIFLTQGSNPRLMSSALAGRFFTSSATWEAAYGCYCTCGRPGFDPWVGKVPWRRERLPNPLFWPGEFHGLYNPWGHKELDQTERLSLSFLKATVTLQILYHAVLLPENLKYALHLISTHAYFML